MPNIIKQHKTEDTTSYALDLCKILLKTKHAYTPQSIYLKINLKKQCDKV